MKILHISYSDYIGGASRAALRIHKSLLKQKIDSRFYVIKKSNKNNKRVHQIDINFFQTFKILINKLTNLIFKGKSSILSLNLFDSKFIDKINNSNYDIVNLHWINNEVLSIKDIKKINKKIIWTCHDMWPFGGVYHYFFEKDLGQNFIDKFIYDLKNRELKEKNIFYVGVSSWIKKSVDKYIKHKNYKSFSINNPTDKNFWRPLSKSKKKNNNKYFKIGIGNIQEILFGKIERNYDRKGKDLFFSVIENLKNNSKIKFKIIEFGNKKLNLVPTNIKHINHGILSNDKNIRQIYNDMDLLIIPSKIEAFGQIASEAILCGTPVLGFRKTGLQDIIIHKKNGWLSNKYNIEDMIKGIDYFQKKRIEKKIIRSTLKNKFSYKSIAKQYIGVYKKRLYEKN